MRVRWRKVSNIHQVKAAPPKVVLMANTVSICMNFSDFPTLLLLFCPTLRAHFATQVNYLLLKEKGTEAELISQWSAVGVNN